MFKNLNLQLFAETIESEGYLGDLEQPEDIVVDEETEEEILDEEIVDEEEVEDEENPSLDKKTKAIIKHKKEAQALKIQLQEMQEKLEARELEDEQTTRIQELTKAGISPEEATKTAKSESEVKSLRLKVTRMELNRLENKYPGISSYSQELLNDKAKLPEYSFEQLYLANYSKQSEYDRRTKLEQEIAYKNRTARSLDQSDAKPAEVIKLSPSDEKTYQYLKRSRPSMTRKQYQSLMDTQSLEK